MRRATVLALRKFESFWARNLDLGSVHQIFCVSIGDQSQDLDYPHN